jgi:hypothetical protein
MVLARGAGLHGIFADNCRHFIWFLRAGRVCLGPFRKSWGLTDRRDDLAAVVAPAVDARPGGVVNSLSTRVDSGNPRANLPYGQICSKHGENTVFHPAQNCAQGQAAAERHSEQNGNTCFSPENTSSTRVWFAWADGVHFPAHCSTRFLPVFSGVPVSGGAPITPAIRKNGNHGFRFVHVVVQAVRLSPRRYGAVHSPTWVERRSATNCDSVQSSATAISFRLRQRDVGILT